MTTATLLRYGCVPVAVAAAIFCENVSQPLTGGMPFLFLWPAVAVCAWCGGLGPGLLATLLGVAAADYFLVEPRFMLSFHKPHEVPWVILFVALGALQSVLGEQLHKLRRRLEQADRNKNEFVATLAHELRGPLSAVRNAAEVLRRSPDRIDWALGLIDRQAEQMDRLVGDVLDISRINRGKLTLENEPVDMSEVVRLAVEASTPLIESRGHRLTVSVPPEPVYVNGDCKRLTQVVQNLLSNAAKYTHDRGQIWLMLERRDQEVVVQVRDTGMGLAADMLTKVFELYTQAADSRSSQGGLGIGLSLVRRLVEMHGGAVEAHSPGLGHGSAFIVRLAEAPAPSPVKAGV